MSSPLQKLYNDYITPKFWKDVKFGIITFIAMCAVLFHYAWIMRQLLTNRDITYEKGTTYFVVLGINCYVMGYIVLKKAYPIIYKEEIANEKKEQ